MSLFLSKLQTVQNLPENNESATLTWIDETGKEATQLHLKQLWEISGFVADKLLSKVNPGDRVMLVYPFGIEFLVGLLACMRAGVIAVSVYPPNPSNFKSDVVKFNRFVEDSGSNVALTTKKYYYGAKAKQIASLFGGAAWPEGLEWLCTDDTVPKGYSRRMVDASVTPEQVAFVQYTSGSTGNPKGVMISYRALDANLESIKECFQISEDSTCVSWLPQYHDYGLIGSYLSYCYCRCNLIAFSPLTFIKNPLLWPELIEKHSATHTKAPNFGYSLLWKRINQSKRRFNLSSLQTANIAAEPIAPSTLTKMKAMGIPEDAIDQTYGCAEFCLHICSGGSGVDDATGVPSCGLISQSEKLGKRIVIVSEEHGKVLPEGEVGTIMAAGPDKSIGYWGKPELTEKTMNVKLLECPGIEWYNTGDLGFIRNGELYVVGRQKETIIVQGRNFYPQDIEQVLEEDFEGLVRPGCICAGQYIDSAFIMAELYPGKEPPTDADIAKLRAKILTSCNIPVNKVLFIEKGSLMKTTSGKIRRVAITSAVQSDSIEARTCLKIWSSESSSGLEEETDNAMASPQQPRIAIVGAGPSGLVTALSLIDRGYTDITMYERESRVGGRSVGTEDGYDQFYIWSLSYKAVALLAKRFGVASDLSEMVVGVEDCQSLPAPWPMPFSSGEEEDSSACDNLFVKPTLELWAKAGYGVFDDTTANSKYFKTFAKSNGESEKGKMQDLVQFNNPDLMTQIMKKQFFPRHFFTDLWSGVETHLREAGVNIFLNYQVKAVDHGLLDGMRFDNIVMTVLPADALAVYPKYRASGLLATLKETRRNKYGVVVFEASGLSMDEYSWSEAHQSMSKVGEPLQIYRRGNVWYALVYSGLDVPLGRDAEQLKEEAVISRLQKAVHHLGGQVLKTLSYKMWDFFPHLEEKNARNQRVFDRWEAEVQGEGGMFWTGAFLGFELVETVSRHAHSVVTKHFPDLTEPKRKDPHYPQPFEVDAEYCRRVSSEVWSAMPKGITSLLPKYYKYRDAEEDVVYLNAVPMMDVNGVFQVDPATDVPTPLLELIFGQGYRMHGNLSVKGRFAHSFNMLTPEFAPTFGMKLEGAAFLSFTSTLAVIPIHSKTLFDVSNAYLRGGVYDGFDEKELEWSKRRTWDVENENPRHLFDCELSSLGLPDVFHTEEHIGLVCLVPRNCNSTSSNDGDDPMELSNDILSAGDVVYDAFIQYRSWRDMDAFLDKERVHLGMWNDDIADKWQDIPRKRLGTLVFNCQDPRVVDHDMEEPMEWTLAYGASGIDGVPKNNLCVARCFQATQDPVIPLSTKTYESLLSQQKGSTLTFIMNRVKAMLEIDEISPEDAPVDIGLSSLQLVQLSNFIESVYKVEMPMTTFFDLPSLADVAKYVDCKINGEVYTPTSDVRITTLKAGSVVPNEARVDVWCLPPIIGSGAYRALSSRLPKHIVLAELVHLTQYLDERAFDGTPEDIARACANAILRQQPKGPYKLLGYSFGSLFAHLVSSRLTNKKSGQHVESLILVDGAAPGPARFSSAKLPLSSKTTIDYITHHFEAAKDVQLQRSPAEKVIFVRSGDQDFFEHYEKEKTTLGWKEVEPDLQVESIPEAFHLTIMAEPHASKLAEIVSTEVQRTLKPVVRVLCLPGWRTNASILRFQLRDFEAAVSGYGHYDMELSFLQPRMLASGKPHDCIVQTFGSSGSKLFEWWQTKLSPLGFYQREGMEESIEYLQRELGCSPEGPFDVVLGFSQGGAILSALEKRGDKVSKLPKCSILMGAIPSDDHILQSILSKHWPQLLNALSVVAPIAYGAFMHLGSLLLLLLGLLAIFQSSNEDWRGYCGGGISVLFLAILWIGSVRQRRLNLKDASNLNNTKIDRTRSTLHVVGRTDGYRSQSERVYHLDTNVGDQKTLLYSHEGHCPPTSQRSQPELTEIAKWIEVNVIESKRQNVAA